jgi:hypothetical protein
LLGRETVATVDGPPGSRLKRNLGDAAALTARRFEQLSGVAGERAALAAAGTLARRAAIVATPGFVGKAFARKKFLLACGKRERAAAVEAA